MKWVLLNTSCERAKMNKLIFITLILALVVINNTNAASNSGSNSETKRVREDIVKEEYEKKLDEQEEKHQKTIEIKEIKFRPKVDEHDYQFKKKHAEKFLNEGAKLKAFVFFKGRSIIFKEQGQILLLRLAQELEEIGTVEQMPELEGKRMIMFITPKKK